MSQDYIYSIATDTANGALSDTLEQEIIAAGIVIQLQNIQNTSQAPDDLVITFAQPLSTADKSTLDSVIAAHQGVSTPKVNVVELDHPKDAEGHPILRTSNVPLDEKLRVRHKGIMRATIAAGQSLDIDWDIEQLTYLGVNKPSYMTGIKYGVKDGNDGDYVDFCIIDKHGNYSPAGTVLDAFGDNVYVYPNERSEIREHKADLVPGLTIRAHYQNTGASDATFSCTLLRYLDTQ